MNLHLAFLSFQSDNLVTDEQENQYNGGESNTLLFLLSLYLLLKLTTFMLLQAAT